MSIYYLLYALTLTTVYMSLFIKKINHNIVVVFFLIILIILASLRYKTGTDFNAYLSLFEVSTPIYVGYGMEYGYDFYEVGFRILTSLIKTITIQPIVYFFVLSFIPIMFIYYSIQEYKLNKIMSIFIFVSIFYLDYVFNAMGQAISMSIFLYSTKYFIKKNTLMIIIITFITTFLHKTGLLILVAYIGYRLIRNIRIDYLFFIGIPLMLSVYKFKLLVLIFSMLFSSMAGVYLEFYNEPNSLFQIISRIAVTALLYFFYTQSKQDNLYKDIFIIYLVGLYLYIGLSDYNMLSTRINMFFRILEVLLFGISLFKAKNIFTKNIIMISIIIICSVPFFKTANNPLFVYQTVLEG